MHMIVHVHMYHPPLAEHQQFWATPCHRGI